MNESQDSGLPRAVHPGKLPGVHPDLPVAGAQAAPIPRRHPSWLKVRAPSGERYRFLQGLLHSRGLHTVCEEAECPNLGECWGQGTATFMLLGDTCTRGCAFCAVGKGRPRPPDPLEPEKVAEAVEALGLRHVVLTSVDRDDLPDEGAGHFAETVESIRRRAPAASVEALVPDFHAREDCISRLVDAPLRVFAHNVETVPRLYRRVRPGSDYLRSLRVLAVARKLRSDLLVKSSVMLGLGESRGEVLQVLRDLRESGCDIATLGQYLQPSRDQLEVFRYVTPREFEEFAEEGRALGFRSVVSGPLVRSSYHAGEAARESGGLTDVAPALK